MQWNKRTQTSTYNYHSKRSAYIYWMEIDVLHFRRTRTVSRDSPHITDSFQTHIAWFPYDRYDLCAGKKFSDRSDNDRWDWPQFYLSDRGDRSDHMETTLQRSQRSQRQQKYQHALRTLTLFKMAANTNIERAIDLALFMEKVQKNDCLYNKYSKEYRDKHRKINCWKAIGVQFD